MRGSIWELCGASALLLASSCSSSTSGNTSPAQGTPGSGGSFQPGSGGIPQSGSGGAGNGPAGSGGTTDVAGGGGQPVTTFVDAGSGPYPYDPNVAFDWPESNADGGAAQRCEAGHYVGTYSCEVTYADAGVYSLIGPVDLRLAKSQSGEFLTVSGGTLTSAAGILALNATLVGNLNCESGAFDGTLQNGTLSIPPFPPGGTFAGTLSASFVSTGPKLDGTWTLLGQGGFAGYVCHGPWSATWQGN